MYYIIYYIIIYLIIVLYRVLIAAGVHRVRAEVPDVEAGLGARD